MNDPADAIALARRIDLTREPDFTLGGVLVRPTACEVAIGGRTVKLQPRVMQVLVALARARGRPVSREALVEVCWGRVRVGDDALSRCIQRLRRLAETETAGALIIETIPKLGYRLTGGEGEAPEGRSADSHGALLPRRLHRRWWAAAMGIVLATVLAGVWFVAGAPGWPTAPQGVAVVPFDSPPGDSSARGLADSMGDGVAAALARTDLRVMPPEADAGASSAERDASAARRGAAFVVGGRVERTGAVLDVTISVSDLRRREVLWSAAFSGGDAHQALDGQVAYRIFSVLRCAMEANRDESAHVDSESIRLYVRACDVIASGDPDDMRASVVRTLMRQVVRRSPTFAYGWAELGRSSESAARDLPADQAAAVRREARDAAERALRLDPKNGVAVMALCEMAPVVGGLRERDAILRKALVLAPDDPAVNNEESDLLAQAGRLREGLTYAYRTEALEPLRPVFAVELALFLAGTGRVAEARETIDRAAQRWPDNAYVRSYRIAIEAGYGDADRALALLNDPGSRPATWDDPEVDDWRRFILVRRSRVPAQVAAYARSVLVRLAARRTDLTGAVAKLNSLGATDWAFAAIAQSPPSDSFDTRVLLVTSPGGSGMWRDPRFMPLAAKLGLVDFWRRTGKWPDFCDAPDRPYDCRVAAGR